MKLGTKLGRSGLMQEQNLPAARLWLRAAAWSGLGMTPRPPNKPGKAAGWARNG